MVRKIGLFGGTFNPIHFGHINLALELKEKGGLDEVWFIPTYFSPLRADEPMISIENRLKMIRLAVEPILGFSICTLELERPPPSYTIDTIQEIKRLYPKDSFTLLLGEDALIRFNEWKDPLEIVRTLPLLIGSRSQVNLLEKIPQLGLHEEINAAILLGIIETRLFDISASTIRDRLKKNLYCDHLLPPKVLDFIYTNHLYFSPLR